MKLVKAESLPVHVHQVSDVCHVQPRGGAGGVHRDHGGGKEGGHGGPHHWAQGLGASRALVVTIRRWGRHLKTTFGQTKTQSQQLSSTLAILRSLTSVKFAKAAPWGLTLLSLYSVRRVNDSSHWYRQNHKECSVQTLISHVWRMRTVYVYSLPLSWVTVWGTRPGLGLGQHLRWLRRPRSTLPPDVCEVLYVCVCNNNVTVT